MDHFLVISMRSMAVHGDVMDLLLVISVNMRSATQKMVNSVSIVERQKQIQGVTVALQKASR